MSMGSWFGSLQSLDWNGGMGMLVTADGVFIMVTQLECVTMALKDQSYTNK